jgi:glycosyltransferase involved in cell wall biosynthesis
LIDSKLKRTEFLRGENSGLRLFYPAAPYPHKNHRILGEIERSADWPVSELILTVSNDLNPNHEIPWIRCVDKLESDAVIDAYRTVDALLFLSISESFGFPLVEAMSIGLPIICPDLPYARALCGDTAIYFDPHDKDSLYAAVIELSKRRAAGWWPDWSGDLKKIPRDWSEVAEAMLSLATAE